MEKKMGGDSEAAGEVFLAFDPLYHYFFLVLGWERGAAKVALRKTHRFSNSHGMVNWGTEA
jgi:hypothetical protein